MILKATCFKAKKRRLESLLFRGPDGSRTRVRKRIPFPSTIIVHFGDSPPATDVHVFSRPVSSDTTAQGRNPERRFSHR